MADSIASVRDTLPRFLLELETALASAGMSAREPAAATRLDEFAALVRGIAPGSPRSGPAPARLPVCRFWPAALEAASRAVAAPLAAALAPLMPALAWTQNPNYRRQPPGPTFLGRYGYSVIAGPPDGPPALARAPALALGVLLLGPRTHYPRHAHPAVEVYYTLTDGEWWRDEGPWRPQPPGTAIVHAPHVRHAMRAGDAPLLAVYAWRGDLATHARLTS